MGRAVACPLIWWRDHGSGLGPVRTLAQRYLTAPATTAGVERLFSKRIFSHFAFFSLHDSNRKNPPPSLRRRSPILALRWTPSNWLITCGFVACPSSIGSETLALLVRNCVALMRSEFFLLDFLRWLRSFWFKVPPTAPDSRISRFPSVFVSFAFFNAN